MEPSLSPYTGVLVLMFLAGGFVITMLLASIFLGPKKFSEVKDEPFECGTIATGDARQRHSVKFYLVAVIFIIFDIEVAFMYPWAVELRSLGWYGFWAMGSFMLVLGVGLAYIWRRGVLDWT